ncbi:hypothetical protein SARC_10353 [Sphaeroforma arctica JP610]|uniref:Kinesin motor domain-containing protein n=1 Tax=Sphaeroforma arctica JP610 TaxID=667725 RepID=A0A0L0FL39_9EUKA|nr:hypothetical protein SARC_10353 [Sphaeroforma arctica JP610]KNC77181.1 hypothetical protein SARC_10353 [Sphaeroforma arctica JP610]|eukprot:XP_014151083.1 hypothetical protein SARC_10353 [Sphaeroforma arctica JP610]
MSLLALGRVVQGLAERAQRTSCLAEQPTEAAQGTFEFEAELPAIPKLEGQGLEVRSSASTLPTKKESFLKRATSINKKKKKFRKRAESQDTVSVCSIASQPVNGSKSDHVPFRDSKLTRILEPSLTGNSLTLVVCAVSMSSTNRHETTSTLGFAANAKLIQCQPVVNKVAVSPRTQVKRLQSENEALKQRLQEAEAESSKAAETLAEEADQTAQAVRALELETSQKVKALETAAVARVQALEKALAEAKKISHQLPLNFKATTSMPKATDTSSDGAQASTSGGSPLLTRRRPTELYNHRERQNRSVTWAPHSHLRGEKRANSPLIKRRLSPTNGSLSGRSMPSPVAVRRAMAERDSDQRTLATPNGSTLEEGPNPSLGMLLRVKESGSEEIAAMTNDTQTGEDGVDNTGVADDTATRPVVADGLSGGSGDTCKTAEVGCTVEATVFSGTSVDGATRQTVGISDTGDVLSGLEASVSEVSIVTEMDNTSKDTEKVEDCDDETASVSFDLNGDGSEDVQEETVSKVRMEEIMENYKTRVVNRDNSRLRLISQLKETVAERDNQLTESGYAALSQKLSVAEGRIISISEQLSLTLVSLSEVQQKYEDAKEAAEDHATEIEAFRLEREEIIEKCKGVLDRQREKAKAATLKMHGIMRMEWEDDLRKSEMEQNILKCQIESEKETVAQLAEELKLSLEDYEYASEEYDKLVIELEEETDKVETLEAKCTKLKAMALELCDHYFACHERAMKEIEDHETDVKEADEREDKLREQIKSDAENRARILELEKKVDSFESKKQEYKAAYVSKSLQFDQLNEQFAALTEELITLQASGLPLGCDALRIIIVWLKRVIQLPQAKLAIERLSLALCAMDADGMRELND